MFGIGTPELVVILVIIAVLFGAKRLPEMGRSLGEGLREFKKAMRSAGTDTDESTEGK